LLELEELVDEDVEVELADDVADGKLLADPVGEPELEPEGDAVDVPESDAVDEPLAVADNEGVELEELVEEAVEVALADEAR
jgi:hypothetical protein